MECFTLIYVNMSNLIARLTLVSGFWVACLLSCLLLWAIRWALPRVEGYHHRLNIQNSKMVSVRIHIREWAFYIYIRTFP